MKCLTCGNEIIENTKGRKKEYCGKQCRDLNNYLNAVEKLLDEVHFDEEYTKRMKGRLMDTVNNMHAKREEPELF